MSSLEFVRGRNPEWLRNGKPLAEDDHLMTRYPKRNFEGAEDSQQDWDWDPRKGPDPKQGDGAPFPDWYGYIPAGAAGVSSAPMAGVFGDVGSTPLNPVPTPPRPASAPTNLSEREMLLMEGAALTGGDRNNEYGEPIDNLTMTGELKLTFWGHMQRNVGPAEGEALDMVLTKLGRLGRGAIKRDTYMDAAVYLAIAYEVAMLEQKGDVDDIKVPF